MPVIETELTRLLAIEHPILLLRWGRQPEANLRRSSRTFPRGSGRRRHDAWKEEVAGDADQHEVGEQKKRPAHVVADRGALVAHKARRGYADASGLRSDRLSNLFTPPDKCKIVQGPIIPQGWCQFFAARENAH